MNEVREGAIVALVSHFRDALEAARLRIAAHGKRIAWQAGRCVARAAAAPIHFA
jgi:hypothetical protein